MFMMIENVGKLNWGQQGCNKIEHWLLVLGIFRFPIKKEVEGGGVNSLCACKD